MIYRIQRSPEGDPAPSGTPATPAAPVIESNEFTDEDFNNTPVMGEKPNANATSGNTDDSNPSRTDGQKPNDGTPAPENSGDPDPATTGTNDLDGDEGELTLGDEPTPPAVTPEDDTDWGDIAEELEVGTKETIKDFDTFKDAYKAKLAEASATPANIKELYGEQGEKVFKALSAGTTIEQLQAPLFIFDEAMALEPDEKLTAFYENKGLTPEQIERKIDKLKENEEVDEVIAEINQNIRSNRQAKAQQIIDAAAQQSDRIQQQQQQQQATLNKSMTDLLAKREDYLGQKIRKADIATIIKRVESGVYDKVLNTSAEARIEAILTLEFGAKAKENLVRTATKTGKEGVLDNLANIDTAKRNGKGASSQAAAPAAPAKPFSSWGEINKEKVTIGIGEDDE